MHGVNNCKCVKALTLRENRAKRAYHALIERSGIEWDRYDPQVAHTPSASFTKMMAYNGHSKVGPVKRQRVRHRYEPYVKTPRAFKYEEVSEEDTLTE